MGRDEPHSVHEYLLQGSAVQTREEGLESGLGEWVSRYIDLSELACGQTLDQQLHAMLLLLGKRLVQDYLLKHQLVQAL